MKLMVKVSLDFKLKGLTIAGLEQDFFEKSIMTLMTAGQTVTIG